MNLGEHSKLLLKAKDQMSFAFCLNLYYSYPTFKIIILSELY